MHALKRIFYTIITASLFVLGTAAAQDDLDDSTAVWIAVEAQWDAEENGDKKWLDNMLSDSFYGWGKSNPAPRSKSSTRMWDRFNDGQGNMVAHELYPLEIVIEGDTAIAHYLYSSAYENNDGEVKTSHGRFTDILVRTDDGWKFLGWHGGDD